MTERFLGRYAAYAYALLRVVIGLMFLLHGTQKLVGFPASGKPSGPLDGLMTAAGVIEIVAGLMILIGLYAGLAAFIASGEMAVAYFMVHQPNGALPIQNGGELAVIYCFVFLYIAAQGSGILSVDSMARRDVTGPTDRSTADA
jgi:putative oxidoreductase